MTAAKVMDIISRIPGCSGQAADAVSAISQVKNGRCINVIESSKARMSRYLDSSTKALMAKIMVQYGRSSRSSRAKSVWSSSGRAILGKAIRESSITIRLGKSSKLGMLYSSNEKKDHSCLCMCTISKLAGKKQNIDPMWKYL